MVEDPNLWNDQEKAQKLLQERTQLENQINQFGVLQQELDDNQALIELAREEKDDETLAEILTSMQALDQNARKLQIESILSGEMDTNDCYMEINSGAGGTEAQDWTEIILRMYRRWAESKGYKVDYLEETVGEEAGIKSVTIQIKGHNAYGWLKTESGVHRLVRISPFDSNAKRHTSFASVAISPVINDDIDIDIAESDLRIDTYRASGAGGQHVNTTDSAIRITHIPTNIVVQCQQERSQHKNKAKAMKMLQAKLYDYEMRKKQEKIDASNAEKTDIGWGHQIRSYVLHPYQMIKDLRTQVETSRSKEVLDGELDQFLEAALVKLTSR